MLSQMACKAGSHDPLRDFTQEGNVRYRSAVLICMLVSRPCFLRRGVMTASFRQSGTVAESRELLMTDIMCGRRQPSTAGCFNNAVGAGSSMQDLPTNPRTSVIISACVTRGKQSKTITVTLSQADGSTDDTSCCTLSKVMQMLASLAWKKWTQQSASSSSSHEKVDIALWSTEGP